MMRERWLRVAALLAGSIAGFTYGVCRWNGDAMRSVYEYGYTEGFRAGRFHGRCEVASPTVVRGLDSDRELTQ